MKKPSRKNPKTASLATPIVVTQLDTPFIQSPSDMTLRLVQFVGGQDPERNSIALNFFASFFV